MALNWAMLSGDEPIPLPNEINISSTSGAEILLSLPDKPPLKEIGRIWLTDQRFVFVAENAKDAHNKSTHAAPPALTSLSVPLHSILSTSFNQPVFGANYLSFEINPSPEGGLVAGTKCEIRFRDKAMFQFVSLLEKTRERWIYMRRQAQEDELEEGLPSYSSTSHTPVPVVSSNRYDARAADDRPPGYEA